MTTKRHEDEKVQNTDEKKRARDEAAEAAEKRQPTEDPMATPTWPVHGPNPPSE